MKERKQAVSRRDGLLLAKLQALDSEAANEYLRLAAQKGSEDRETLFQLGIREGYRRAVKEAEAMGLVKEVRR